MGAQQVDQHIVILGEASEYTGEHGVEGDPIKWSTRSGTSSWWR
jgi:hypothetical protein